MRTPADAGPVLITGCSSGLGRASARLFRAGGYLTIATAPARDEAELAELRALGCETYALDVTEEEQRRAVVAAVEARHGAVGVLVNNAGYGQYGPMEEISLDLIRACFEVNLFGMIRMAQLVLPGMRRAGRGRIVNISSVAGRATTAGGGVYHMTKYGVEALADALRPEVKPFGIDVVNVLPGPFVSGYRDKVVASIPDTGPHSPYVLFREKLGAWMVHFLKPGGLGVMTAEHVARTVVKAATVKRPRTRYNVGLYARLSPFGRALTPDRVVDAVMSWQIPVQAKAGSTALTSRTSVSGCGSSQPGTDS